MNLQGSINLLKLPGVKIVAMPGVNAGEKVYGLFVPIEQNNLFMMRDKETNELSGAMLSVSVLERRTPSENGHTHYVKPGISKEFKERHPVEAEVLKDTYLGNMKPLEFTVAQQVVEKQAVSLEPTEYNDLPF